MSSIISTHINYYFICRRKLWLFSHGIHMEHESDLVYEGRMIGEESYTDRSKKYTEIEIMGSKIDYYDPKRKIVHEVKKSDQMEIAHEWQVKYYIWLLKQSGIEDVEGMLEYPKMKIKKKVILTEEDENTLKQIVKDIELIINQKSCPPCIHKKYCHSCSYFDFCYVIE